MIVVWKKVSALEFTTKWKDMHVQLLWDPTEHRWQVWVDGTRTRERWHSSSAAIDAVDEILNRQIRAMAATVTARPRTAALLTREGGFLHYAVSV